MQSEFDTVAAEELDDARGGADGKNALGVGEGYGLDRVGQAVVAHGAEAEILCVERALRVAALGGRLGVGRRGAASPGRRRAPVAVGSCVAGPFVAHGCSEWEGGKSVFLLFTWFTWFTK